MKWWRVFIVCIGVACALCVSACGIREVTVSQQRADVPAASATRVGSTPAAGSCQSGSSFALSLASDVGGQPTPIAAASWFAVHGGVPAVPKTGWRLMTTGGTSATVKSHAVTLHVIEGTDRTWQVDSGETCG